MGFFFRDVKPQFDWVNFWEEYQWEIGIGIGLILSLIALVCRCLSAGKEVLETLPPMEELESPVADTSTEEEADRTTPRRSARLRNKRKASIK